MSGVQGKHVLLGVMGGIAAYKACEVLRGLQKVGCDVRVIMTEDAQRFVGEVTFEALSGHPVATDLYSFPDSPIPHIMLTEWADLFLLVPATGNVMAKMAMGIADDALSSALLAADSPVLVAPAMNVRMWSNPATQANLHTLLDRGVRFVMPTSGRLACGDVGEGKLADVSDIVAAALQELAGEDGVANAEKPWLQAVIDAPSDEAPLTQADVEPQADDASLLQDAAAANTPEDFISALRTAAAFSGGSLVIEDKVRDLDGWSFLITAGPTREAIDPVRYLSNASTGKMGYTIARRAVERGASVALVSGPVALAAPEGVELVPVTSAAEMYEAATSRFDRRVDCAICTAAVADYTPKAPSQHKLKKGIEPLECIELVETKDILAALAAAKNAGQVVVGFAAETDRLIAYAQDKLVRKGCDLIVANDVSRPDSTFGADTSRIALVDAEGVEEFDTLPLDEVADVILDRVCALMEFSL